MKRATIIIILVLTFILGSSVASATSLPQPCTQTGTFSCGSTPSSIQGFGAVEICGDCHVCGADDGVCPEDFYSDGVQGSCASCPDPQCTGTIHGKVNDSQGIPVVNAEIMARYPGTQSFQKVAETTTNGVYLEPIMSADPISLFARYEGQNMAGYTEVYVSDIKDITLERGESEEVNFTVSLAACTANCTRVGNIACDESCHGQNGCYFAEDNQQGIFAADTKLILDGVIDGTKTVLKTEKDCDAETQTDYFTTRCSGPVQEEVRYYPPGSCAGQNSGYQILDTDDNKLNLISRTVRVYTEQGEMAVLTIVYWEGEEAK